MTTTDQILETLEELCLSLDDSCTLMQSLAPAMKQTGSTEHIVAGLMAQERLKKLCCLLGHQTKCKLTGLTHES